MSKVAHLVITGGATPTFPPAKALMTKKQQIILRRPAGLNGDVFSDNSLRRHQNNEHYKAETSPKETKGTGPFWALKPFHTGSNPAPPLVTVTLLARV